MIPFIKNNAWGNIKGGEKDVENPTYERQLLTRGSLDTSYIIHRVIYQGD